MSMQDLLAGVVEGPLGLVDLGSQGVSWLGKRAGLLPEEFEPLQYGQAATGAMGLEPDRNSMTYLAGNVLGSGGVVGGARAAGTALARQGGGNAARAFGGTLADEAVGTAGGMAATAAAEQVTDNELALLLAGLGGGMAAPNASMGIVRRLPGQERRTGIPRAAEHENTLPALRQNRARRAAMRGRREHDPLGILKNAPAPARVDLSGYNLFDYRNIGEDFDSTPQVDIARPKGANAGKVNPLGYMSPRMADLYRDPYVNEALDVAVQRGAEYWPWYDVEEFRKAFLDSNPEVQDFLNFMQFQAGASARNPVPQQLKAGSYLWHLYKTGQLRPDMEPRDITMPPGYGGLAQKLWKQDALDIARNPDAGIDPFRSPKRASYAANWGLNWRPVTVDTHAVKLPAMASMDPRWLATSVEVSENGVKSRINPREQYDAGQLSLAEMLTRPGVWETAPTAGEYRHFENMWQDAAARNGLPAPASGQAAGWVGGGELTGLKSPPQYFQQAIEDAVMRTARELNMTPGQVIRDVAMGRIYFR